MLDLFVDYWYGKTKADIESTAIITADLGHGNHQESIDYFNGISNNLTYPLTCIRNILDLGKATMNAAYGAVIADCMK